MSRLYRRRDRINSDVQITQVLSHYGYRVHADNYEQQFPCDLHGDGRDSKPSARVYPQSNSFYCFACDRTRDPIGLVMEKEGIPFAEAIKVLENRHGLPPLPWEEGDYAEKEKHADEQLDDQFEEMANAGTTFESESRKVQRLLDSSVQDWHERSPPYLPMETVLSFYEALDRFVWMFEKGQIDERLGCEAMVKLHTRVKKRLTESA